MNHEQFEEFKALGKLPSPSAIGLKILEITSDPHYDQEELTATIMADPALSGRLLMLANSALCDGLVAAASVDQAAVRLGSTSVRALALGFTLIADNLSGSCKAFDYEGFWSGALASAVAASSIATLCGGLVPAEAFTCALLLDIGRLALASVHGEAYGRMLLAAPQVQDDSLQQLEQRTFAIDHVELGCYLLSDWGLPESFVEALRNHLQADISALASSSGEERLPALMRAAKSLGRLLAKAGTDESASFATELLTLRKLMRTLGLEVSRARSLLQGCLDGWQLWSAQLKLPAQTQLDLMRILPQAEQAAEAGDQLEFPPAARSQRESNVGEALQVKPEQKIRVLLVDDDERILRLLAYHLGQNGYEVHQVSSSKSGLALALELRPQILITDWTMPEMSGVELCRLLSRSDCGRKIHKIMLTGRDDDEQVIEAFDAGAADYVFKPFNPRILLARVRAGERMIRMREQVEKSERVHHRQVAELGILTRKLRAAAMTDPLTDLPNRRFAMTRLKQEWEAVARSGRALAVSMIDIDHFKRVNDQYGHDAGDLVLREVASVLRLRCRQSDVLCRLGGEEFLVIHIDTELSGALRGAERLRYSMERHMIRGEIFQGNVTISVGVAQREAQMRGIDDLLKLADQGLYEAKLAGRNQVAARASAGPTAQSA